MTNTDTVDSETDEKPSQIDTVGVAHHCAQELDAAVKEALQDYFDANDDATPDDEIDIILLVKDNGGNATGIARTITVDLSQFKLD